MFNLTELEEICQPYLYDDYKNWANYLYTIQNAFKNITNKTVLEVGPFVGNHTILLEKFNPKSITLIEPNLTNGITELKRRFANHEIINDDIFLYLEKPRKFDVVMCYGVLYHLHSPIHLLEMIVNRCDPDYILLETTNGHLYSTGEDSGAFFVSEPDNTDGNRYSMGDWKSSKISVVVPQEIINLAMNNLGYKNIYFQNLYGKNLHISKQSVIISSWIKKDLFKDTL
jgi:SAM-dependent methyltransferase